MNSLDKFGFYGGFIHKKETYADNRVVVTGGTGFLGRAVCKRLEEEGFAPVALGSKDYDLTNTTDVHEMYKKECPETIIHLAAVVGGIGANKENPGKFIEKNLGMGFNLIKSAREFHVGFKVKKFVMIGTVCSYPKFTPVPFKEEDLWNGYPEETNAPYGIAKKTCMQMIQSYNQQYGFNGINLIPVNMYGPHDNFDPKSSHVIPALILKFHEAMQGSTHEDVEIWGTGEASREFLYVDDCAEAIVLATQKLNDPEPVNIGTGKEIKIKDLVNMIQSYMGHKGSIYFNSEYPDGQPRRCLDVSKAKEKFGFEAKTSFEEGLGKTIEWFKSTL
jgi:GDP-L-fucose synthase